MAIIATEGFGMSLNPADYNSYGSWAIGGNVYTGGAFGSNYLGNGGGTLNLNGFYTNFVVGCRLNLQGNTNYIRWNSNYGVGAVSFAPGGQITFAGSGSHAPVFASYPASGWFYAEIAFVYPTTTSSADGSIIVRVNGVQVMSYTGLTDAADTEGTLNTSYITFAVSGCQDIYVCDNTGAAPWNTFLGDVRIQTLLPTGSVSTGFTAVGGASNWQNAAQVPPTPSIDYNTANTVGATDTFTVSAPVPTSLIYGVNVKVIAEKTDAGLRDIATQVVSGGTTSNGVSVGLSLSPKQLNTILETDPNTSAAWTLSAVEAMNIGYTLTV